MVIKRVGGKTKISEWICHYLPCAKIFVDTFGGSGAVLDATMKHKIFDRYVYNDLDSKLYNFFNILQNKNIDLAHAINLTPYSRRLFTESQQILNSPEYELLSDIDKAVVFLVANRQSFGAKMEPHWSITINGEINYETWQKLPKLILNSFQIWKNVYLEQLDYKDILKKWDSSDTLFYLDPPYEGVEDDYYNINKKHGFNHLEMLESLSHITGSYVVSYYGGETESDDSDLIKAYVSNECRIIRKKVTKHLSYNKRNNAVEILIIKGKLNSNDLFN